MVGGEARAVGSFAKDNWVADGRMEGGIPRTSHQSSAMPLQPLSSLMDDDDAGLAGATIKKHTPPRRMAHMASSQCEGSVEVDDGFLKGDVRQPAGGRRG